MILFLNTYTRSLICQLTSEFAGPCLLQFNDVFSKFVTGKCKKKMLHKRMVVPVVQKLCFIVGAVAGTKYECVLLQINSA